MFKDFYQDLFIIDIDTINWSQTLFTYPRLDDYTKTLFREYIIDGEIKVVVFDMMLWKALVPYGFLSIFY